VYTPAGNLTSVTFGGFPSKTTPSIVYTHDVKGRPTVIDAKVGAAATTLAADIVFDAADRVRNARYGNGTSGAWSFNAKSDHLDKITYTNATSGVLAAVAHVFDANDNVVEESREKLGAAGIFSQKLHTYDALDRLRTSNVSSPSGNQAESYAFSPSGNVLVAGGDLYTYGSPVTAQAASVVVGSEKQRALTYDADGYLTSDSETRDDGSSSTRTLAFDPTGCMRLIMRTDVAASGTTNASSDYTCGLDGRVVARATTKLDGTQSRRIDFAGIAEIRPDEGIFLLRVPLHGSVSVEDARSLATGDRVTAMSGYLISDARGTELATTGFDSATPDLTREAEYAAWGKKLAGYSALPSPRHGFVGAEADEAAGTYSFGARTYDPSLRRWVSPDPLLAAAPHLDEYVGESLNLYSYADGNPVKNTDKSGYCPLCIVAIAGGIIFLGQTLASDDAKTQQEVHKDKSPAEKISMSAGMLTAPVAIAGAVVSLAAPAAPAARAAAGAADDPNCFVEGTGVLTESGLQPIETIVPGDRVWARADDATSPRLAVVTRAFITAAAAVIDVAVESESGHREQLRVTLEHPFWVIGREWVPAGQLRAGDNLFSQGGQRWRVVEERPVSERQTVFNIEVGGDHSYFVGAAELWVHNTCDAAQLKANAAQGAKGEQIAKVEASKTQSGVQEQVTIKTTGGRTKLDLAGKDNATGATKLTEVKTGGAKLNPNQVARFAEIKTSGGTVAGAGKPGFPGGTQIPPTTVDVVRPKVP
jgi:RHS repeat-associated protein